ncbi:hypothetical protein CRE_18024 [Caenorhabditis remanei]|uniref:Uncharacterized protein n=1 Tax=Caenorhabditis remanei TaxID=31234 RepID=E3MTU2_CAERE|nr:hypothetical protein CRE_18024 [Caenorhabditis remanei]
MISPKTQKYQRSFFLGTIVQAVVPLIFLVIPAVTAISSIYFDCYNQALNHSCTLLLSFHGFASTIIITLVHHPYRRFLIKVVTFYRNSEKYVSSSVPDVVNNVQDGMRRLSDRVNPTFQLKNYMTTSTDLYYETVWKSKCSSNEKSFLASWQGFSLFSHSMLVVFLPFYVFTPYCILKKTPRTMDSVKFVLLNAHCWYILDDCNHLFPGIRKRATWGVTLFHQYVQYKNHCRLKHPVATAPVNPADISLAENSSEPEKKKYRLCTGEVEPLTPVGRISSSVTVQNQRIRCHHPDCTKEEDVEYHLVSRAALCEHFRTEHGTDHMLEQVSFKNEDDYKKWLARRQEDTGTSSITQSTREEVGRITCYKKCKHEGSYERKGNMKFGHPSKKWTGEITCTSFLKLIRTKHSIQVEACFSHFGHDISVADLSLTSKQKERITEMVAQGLPNNLIVKQAKNEFTENSRMHF